MTRDHIEFVREIARKLFSSQAHHEAELPLRLKKKMLIQGILDRLGIDEKTVEREDYEEDGDIMTATVEQYACYLLDDAIYSIEYHEQGLKKTHRDMALFKIMFARGNYSDKINLDEIEAEQRRRVRK